MSEKKPADSIDYILNSQLSGVLSKAFSELYREKPDFPVSYLAKWLKNYSQATSDKIKQSSAIAANISEFNKLEEQKESRRKESEKKIMEEQASLQSKEAEFEKKLEETQHLEDLLRTWVPEYLEKRYNLTGAYVGKLTHPYKALEVHNFEPGAELDAEAPQIIEYIGSSVSHEKTMHMKILPNENGVSYEVFNEPEPEPEEAGEGEENPAPKQAKKTYIYVPDVTKNEKIFYFKYPKLGSYSCFPLKLSSYLNIEAFDNGITEYKEYVRVKEDTDREHSDKVQEARIQYDELKKKLDEFEVPEEPNPDAEAEKAALEEEVKKAEEKLQQIEKNPPVTPEPSFKVIIKSYMVGCDTLGKDRQFTEEELCEIDKKTKLFIQSFKEKEKQMLLNDILTYIKEENKIDALENQYREFQKNAISQSEESTKEKFTREKELEYETSLAKWKKMEGIFEESAFENSMKTYFSYNIPKYRQIVQIALMLLRYEKSEINIARTNILDMRKVSESKFLEEFMNKLMEYNLAPESADDCHEEYKINKILERLEKINLEDVLKYNAFIWALANHIKGLCWTRIQCRDAKVEAYEMSIKAKEEREAEIQKYAEDLEKALEAHKADLTEETQPSFNEETWRAEYANENPKPDPLQEIELKKYLDIE